MGLTGDFAALLKFSEQIGDLGDGKAVSKIAETAVPKISALVDQQVASGVSPYGESWAPRKSDGAQALQTMRSRISVEAQGDSVVVELEEHPGIYHQTGTVRMVQRQLIPTDSDGIPGGWALALQEAANEVMPEGSSSGGQE